MYRTSEPFYEHVPALCRGMALWLRGVYEESLVLFEQALTLSPYDDEVYFWVGMACAALGKNQEAWDALEHALHLSLPRFMLAPLKLLQERNPEFIEQYARKLLPTS